MIVLFQGYWIFTPNKLPADISLVSNLMQWVAIGLIMLLTIGWYVYGGVVHKKWDWEIPKLPRVDTVNGCAPYDPASSGKPMNWFRKIVKWVLDKL
jgi:hypothetical protein